MASYRIGVGTTDGENITEHFGRLKQFKIIEINSETGEELFIADIEVVVVCGQSEGSHDDLIQDKVQALLDFNVKAILVNHIGPGAERIVTKNGIEVLIHDGSVREALDTLKKYYSKQLNIL
ncbi:MAG: hypothetical protein ILP13_03125 [Lachnospiraceae bacterium]|nr:hypothetical protein [Lachnospiraceae bacterium]